jgi:hypothetical protein
MSALAAPPDARTDLALLQGAWTTIAGPTEARLLVAGNRFAFEFVGGDIYFGTFTLTPGSGVGQMNMHIEDGPDHHRDHDAACIYNVEGDILRWCPGRPGSGRRPGAFPSVDDRRYLSLVFRHTRRKTGHRAI